MEETSDLHERPVQAAESSDRQGTGTTTDYSGVVP